jgi:phytoene dehydrogenase-like protein
VRKGERVRYDAAIIGAGPDGLAAATRLARAGLSTIVIDQAATAGGRCSTREFHPGFRASPYQDELPPIPAEIFWQLDLARRGALFLPDAQQVVLHSGGTRWTFRGDTPFLATARARILAALDESDARAATPPRTGWFRRVPLQGPPSRDIWSEQSLIDCLSDCESGEAAALLALSLSGRTADPALRGTAVNLLALANGGMVSGGLGRFAEALGSAARDAGVQFALGVEASELHLNDGKVTRVVLADGRAVDAMCVVSTLDLKRTFLSLFSWSELPAPVVKRAAGYRPGGGTARLLVALEGTAGVSRSVFHLHTAPAEFALAHGQWRAGVLPDHPPATVRVVSAADPILAPRGDATATVTLGAIPHHLFDGPWTGEKRQALRKRALASLELALPGARVVASELIVPSDIEQSLGLTQGDLDGGELAPDQMFGERAFRECPRTPLKGLYLAGLSSALGPSTTCASGWFAAAAVLADRKAGRLK